MVSPVADFHDRDELVGSARRRSRLGSRYWSFRGCRRQRRVLLVIGVPLLGAVLVVLIALIPLRSVRRRIAGGAGAVRGLGLRRRGGECEAQSEREAEKRKQRRERSLGFHIETYASRRPDRT